MTLELKKFDMRNISFKPNFSVQNNPLVLLSSEEKAIFDSLGNVKPIHSNYHTTDPITPLKILKIDKGNLTVGNDADLCIVDVDKPWIVKKEKMISKSKNTSIENKKLQGKVTNTFVKGKELFKL